MDSTFNSRWQAGEQPFDGVTVYLEDFVPVTNLRPMLNRVVQILYERSPNARLFRMLDWHEHDGYVKEAVPTTWQELQLLASSDETLLKASEWDRFVRTVFFPERRDFLLRFYVPDSHDNPFHDAYDPQLVHYGIFDLTSEKSLALQIREAMLDMGAIGVETMAAKAYFDKNYGG